LVYRCGNGFFVMDPREVNSLVCSFFGPAAIDTPIQTVLEIACDQLREGRTVAVQYMLDRLPLPVSPNGARLLYAIAKRQGLAVLDVTVANEQSGTVWDDRDVERFAKLHDDLTPRAYALEKAFNPGSAWDPAKHPRWPGGESDGGQFRPNGEAGGDGASPILPAAARSKTPQPTSRRKPQPKPHTMPQAKPWEKYPNAPIRQKLAELESSADKPNNGYGERNKSTNALGRYQLLKTALIDAGWKNADGKWSDKAKKAGVTSDAQFLKNPEAQEKALTDVMQRYGEQLKAYGATEKIGTTVEDSNGKPLFITESGLMAAAHKEGAPTVAKYLDPNKRSTLRAPQIANIEHRLREAASTPYDASATAAQANTNRRDHNAQKK
jgi:hypothetical protein